VGSPLQIWEVHGWICRPRGSVAVSTILRLQDRRLPRSPDIQLCKIVGCREAPRQILEFISCVQIHQLGEGLVFWAGRDPLICGLAMWNGPLLLLHSRAHRSEACAFASMQGTHIPVVGFCPRGCVLGNVRQGHYVIIARAHSSFSRVSAVAIAMIASICAAARSLGEMSPLLCPGHLSSRKLTSGRRRVKLQ
jgi:hypothetical protein